MRTPMRGRLHDPREMDRGFSKETKRRAHTVPELWTWPRRMHQGKVERILTKKTEPERKEWDLVVDILMTDKQDAYFYLKQKEMVELTIAIQNHTIHHKTTRSASRNEGRTETATTPQNLVRFATQRQKPTGSHSPSMESASRRRHVKQLQTKKARRTIILLPINHITPVQIRSTHLHLSLPFIITPRPHPKKNETPIRPIALEEGRRRQEALSYPQGMGERKHCPAGLRPSKGVGRLQGYCSRR